MGIHKSYKRHFQLKECNKVRLEKQKRNNSIREITKHLAEMDEIQLQTISNIITSKTTHQQANLNNLISTIEQLSYTQLSSAIHLISTMRYSKGANKGNIYSPYLQKKANEYINQTLYKRHVTHQALQESNAKLEIDCKKLHQKNKTLIRKTQSLGVQNMHLCHQNANRISKIRSLARQSRQITNTAFKKQLKNIFKTNKRDYSSNTIWLATNISQVGQISLRSTAECMRLIYEFLIGEPPQNLLATSTLRTWHQDISKLHVDTQIYQAITASSFGILVDESTRGETKNFVLCYQYWNHKDQAPVVTVAHFEDIPNCNADTVSDTAINYIQQDGLDFAKGALWVTDNTAYMSGEKKARLFFLTKKLAQIQLESAVGFILFKLYSIISNKKHLEQFQIVLVSQENHIYTIFYI